MNDLVSMENIIYGSYVKMDRLERIVFETFSNSSIAGATNLNVYIDLYSVLKSIFSSHHRTDISDYTAITSGVINMCSHYRSFFRKLSVNTKFFLIFSFNTCDINEKFVAGYNGEFKKKSEIEVFRQIAMNNFDLLDLICPYLPNIFFVKSIRNYEVGVIIANLIERNFSEMPNTPNLIISKDLYPIQNTYLYPWTSYLYPIKRKGGIDDSVMVPISEKEDYRRKFWGLIGHRRKIDVSSFNISPINFPFFSALNKFPERGIYSEANSVTTKNIIQEIVGAEDREIFVDQLYNDFKIYNKINVALLESRVKALDIRFMLPIYKNDPESLNINMENLDDQGTLNQINAKFLPHNPIDLAKL